ncbi:hypothetical protein [Acinetobacter lactucae]|uniref:DNA-binding protein n=1 Tax=Acinetobacter lactucae TaxID=1785128 RepID=R8Z199_9GAMM|nr:hypothetical protein [Acinetobacter lactucae]EOQ73522.1 hypothetical protein F929_03465 [Acinetobacter lactucae]
MGMATDHELLHKILEEMQSLKKQLAADNERRVSVKEFQERLGWKNTKFYERIKMGEITPPLKDGTYSYYLNSYVNEVVTRRSNSATLAA